MTDPEATCKECQSQLEWTLTMKTRQLEFRCPRCKWTDRITASDVLAIRLMARNAMDNVGQLIKA